MANVSGPRLSKRQLLMSEAQSVLSVLGQTQHLLVIAEEIPIDLLAKILTCFATSGCRLPDNKQLTWNPEID